MTIFLNQQKLLQIYIDFIKNLSESEARTLCLCNGSIWISLNDFMSNNITEDSFCAMGPASDSCIRQYGEDIGYILLTNFDGLADRFILDIDEDEDGNPCVPDQSQVIYSHEVGIDELIDCISSGIDSDLCGLTENISNMSCEN